MDRKPNVVPTKEQINSVKSEKEKKELYEQEKALATNEIYSASFREAEMPTGQLSAIEQMQQRTAHQLNLNAQGMQVKDETLAEAPTYSDVARFRNEEQMRLRDVQLQQNLDNIQKFQDQTAEATVRHQSYQNQQQKPIMEIDNGYQKPPTPPVTPKNGSIWDDYSNQSSDEHINEISQPNYNAPFDVISLPSLGKTYKNKKSNIKLSYMTTADENILSSPNLLQSGEFLEILINRKMLEPSLRYKDLLPGDRNAIMIWLRATGYGEMYPVVIEDEKGIPFETVVNLDDLKTVELTVEPDENGLFTFDLPLARQTIKFRLLTCGEIDFLDKKMEEEKENNVLINNYNTYKLERMIVEVDGSKDRTFISSVANNMRLPDSKKLTEFMNTIDCGIDLDIVVKTPGGGSVATFLPLNLNFFWPNL